MEAFAVASPTPVQGTSLLRGYAAQNVEVIGDLGATSPAATWSTGGLASAAAFVGLLGGLLRSRTSRRARRATGKGVAAKAGRETRLFLDSATVADWDRFLPQGWFYGVTMNPAILERAGLPVSQDCFKHLFEKVQKYDVKEAFFQATGADVETLVKNGKAINAMDPSKAVVKVPLTEEGLRAGKQLKDETGTKLCTTICYSANHGFLSNGLGAEYIAPYLGRIEALSNGGMQQCEELHKIVGGTEGHTRVQVAAIRHSDQMVKLAQAGIDTFTFSTAIAEELVTEEHTSDAAAEFEKAVERASGFKF